MTASTPFWLLLLQLSGSAHLSSQVNSPAGESERLPVVEAQGPVTAQQPPAGFDASRFDSATAITLRGLLEDARELGLPTKSLINRALEGSARRMSGDKIIRVVRELAAALTEAKEVLGPGSTPDELEAAADALRAGYDRKAVASIRATRPPGTAVTALVVLTDLARRGVPANTARDAVTDLSKLPRSDEALLGLQSAVARNAQRGPGMALEALNRYVRGMGGVPGSSGTPATIDRKPVRPPDS